MLCSCQPSKRLFFTSQSVSYLTYGLGVKIHPKYGSLLVIATS